MSTNNFSLTSSQPALLPYKGTRAIVIQIVLIASAVVLPIVAHMLQAPVRILLPMHWPVLLAGLLYGWRAGAVTGALAPLLSYLVSGYPMPNILPSMTFELFAYGIIAGILRERYNLNPFLSIGVAVVVGRIIFIFFVIVTNRASFSDMEYFQRAMLPGIVPALLQILTLPFLAQWLMHMSHKNGSE
jgi:niacin transporter